MRSAVQHQRAILATVAALLMWQGFRVEAAGDVRLTHDGPVLLGGTITFKAELLDDDGKTPSGKFIYKWSDDAIHQHYYETETTTNTTVYYTVSYPAAKYHVGMYRMEVAICKWGFISLFCSDYTSARIKFHVTALINGNITIQQSNKTTEHNYVSSSEVAKLALSLRKGDLDYVNRTSTSIVTYWFIDGCNNVKESNDFKFEYNFTQPGSFHTIEALIMGTYEPPTTTVAPTSTTTSTTPSTGPTSSTTPMSSNLTSTTSSPTKTAIVNTTSTSTSTAAPTEPTTVKSVSVPTGLNQSTPPIERPLFPFVCKSQIDPVPNTTYGYFYKQVNVRAPISKLSIEGSTWIQPWDSLSLAVTCNGSAPFKKCVKIIAGKYNVTGNETCEQNPEILKECKFSFNHYFLDPMEYTVLIILTNDISTEIHPVGINIYKFTPKPQLSVIVVPVSCSLVAMVAIVFGIAYYVQNRSRFTVEVADFDFGQSSTEMEYKTFTERLRDSFNNARYKQLNNAKDSQ